MRLICGATTKGWVYCVLPLPDGQLASASLDGKVMIWSVLPDAVGRITSFDVGARDKRIECMALLPHSTLAL
jgi:hypothetical protein